MVPCIRLQSESELSDFAESVFSSQMNLTASCQDTPDTESSFIESEFSVGSSASSMPSLPEVSSGPEDSYSIFQLAAPKHARKCIKCNISDRISSLPFCRRCYLNRKRFFPPRPVSKRKRRHSDDSTPASKRPMLDSSHSEAQDSDQNPSLCGCCMEAPCDGVFIHGEVGHQIFCYKCAHRVWLERKLCPYCNRTISKVIKLFRVVME
ncbi:Protein Mdm4 [Frankliniella fusca]|uniref:Protein Mdm4 n=1 Tax=Frankliniella fusca TaxID=407009 RepID=A0AAE1GPY3_9NEOP|nr:Protein Mdm4 [Frankliniella fusca]